MFTMNKVFFAGFNAQTFETGYSKVSLRHIADKRPLCRNMRLASINTLGFGIEVIDFTDEMFALWGIANDIVFSFGRTPAEAIGNILRHLQVLLRKNQVSVLDYNKVYRELCDSVPPFI